jgi:hypothetical protein
VRLGTITPPAREPPETPPTAPPETTTSPSTNPQSTHVDFTGTADEWQRWSEHRAGLSSFVLDVFATAALSVLGRASSGTLAGSFDLPSR